MSFDQLLTAALGAFFGAAGWLLVGLYMARRASIKQARNALAYVLNNWRKHRAIERRYRAERGL